MGLFDSLSDVAALAGGGSGTGGGNAALIQGVLSLLNSGGSGNGLAGLLQGFEQQGLGQLVASWVGTGQNLPISADQLIKGLGQGRVQQLAEAAGLPHADAAHALTGLLPTMVDRLTPTGSLPRPDQLEGLLGSLSSLLR